MWAPYRVLAPWLRRYRRAYLLGGVCIVVSVFLRLAVPWLLGDSINELQRWSDAAQEPGGRAGVARAIGRMAVAILLTAAAACLVRSASRLTILGACRRIACDLRGVMFARLSTLAPSFYVRNPTGQIMSRAINDMNNVQSLLGPVILYLAETSVMYAIGIVLMWRVSPELTIAGILPFPLFLWGARRLALRIQEESREAQNALGEIGAKVDESLSGQSVIKTMAIEDLDYAAFRSRAADYRSRNLRVTRSRALLIPWMMTLAAVSSLAVLVLGGPRVARGELLVGDLLKIFLYLRSFAGPTRTLGFVISSLRRGASALERIREVLVAVPELVDPPRPAEPASAQGAPTIELRELTVTHPPLARQPHLSGSLAVSSAHDDRERTVLDRVSLVVPAGTTLGIVGAVGSGKTTIARAIVRLLEIGPGQVFFDGVDVTTLRLDDVRRRVGYVPQEAFLFSASLADNVALGRPEAERAAIERAVRDASLAADLSELPAGLDTIVGERGVRLSGGQRQRTALARVLLLSPDVLVLDDTLSAVDTVTAEEILRVLRPFAAQRTTVLVSHRLSTLAHADEIIVLEAGRIAERGTHRELCARGGRYADLWRRQELEAREASERERLRRELEDELRDPSEVGGR